MHLQALTGCEESRLQEEMYEERDNSLLQTQPGKVAVQFALRYAPLSFPTHRRPRARRSACSSSAHREAVRGWREEKCEQACSCRGATVAGFTVRVNVESASGVGLYTSKRTFEGSAPTAVGI